MGYRYNFFLYGFTLLIEGLFYGIATWIVLTVIFRRPITTRVSTPRKGEGFNWMLPLLGATGFWIGFAYTCAISLTTYDSARNAFAHYDPSLQGAGVEVGIFRGIMVGAIGGAALGLAFKDKKQALHFSLAGAIGFAIAFALAISLGSGEGAIVGAIGGLGLGLASRKGRIVSSLLLCLTGAIWFTNAFAIHHAGGIDAWGSWDGRAGAVGGAIFGLTLALYYRIHDKMYSKTVVDDVGKFAGEWENEAGNLIVIQQKTDQSCSVSFFKGSDSEPVLRPYYENSPSLEMESHLTEHGTTLEVELWEEGKGYNLHLTYERAYESDEERRDSLVAALSRYTEDAFLDQYDHLFEPLEHYTKRVAC